MPTDQLTKNLPTTLAEVTDGGPIRGRRVPHAPWCSRRHGGTWMEDERTAGLPTLWEEDAILKQLQEAGHEVWRVYIRHPGFGPEMYLRSCEVALLRRIRRAQVATTDRILGTL